MRSNFLEAPGSILHGVSSAHRNISHTSCHWLWEEDRTERGAENEVSNVKKVREMGKVLLSGRFYSWSDNLMSHTVITKWRARYEHGRYQKSFRNAGKFCRRFQTKEFRWGGQNSDWTIKWRCTLEPHSITKSIMTGSSHTPGRDGKIPRYHTPYIKKCCCYFVAPHRLHDYSVSSHPFLQLFLVFSSNFGLLFFIYKLLVYSRWGTLQKLLQMMRKL